MQGRTNRSHKASAVKAWEGVTGIANRLREQEKGWSELAGMMERGGSPLFTIYLTWSNTYLTFGQPGMKVHGVAMLHMSYKS